MVVGASTPAVAGSEGGPRAVAIRAGRLARLPVLAAPMQGLGPILRAPMAIRRMVEASGWEILLLPVRPMAMANGIRLAAQLEVADQKQLNPEPSPQRTLGADGTCLARIARQAQPA
jgi:hypothetical protein